MRLADLRALHVEQADLAVAALANHLAAGGAVAQVARQGAGVGAAWGAGLQAALLAHLTLLGGGQGLEAEDKEGLIIVHGTHNKKYYLKHFSVVFHIKIRIVTNNINFVKLIFWAQLMS